MEEKTKLLFKLFLDLPENQKEEFEKLMSEYKSKGFFDKRTYRESFNKSLGPILSAKCEYCGK